MKRVSLKAISIILLSWFFIIPLVEIGTSNFLEPVSSSILLSMDKSDEKRYQNMDTEKAISDMNTLFEKEFEENKELGSIINKDAFMKLDFEKDANVLGLYFIEDYYFNIVKKVRKSKYDDYLSNQGKTVRNTLVNPSSFEDLLNIEKTRDMSFFSNKYDIAFDATDLKIKLNNDELIDKIKALTYKKHLVDVSYYYGYVFIMVFSIVFMLFAFIIEQRYLKKNVKNFSEKVRNEIESDMDNLMQPFNTLVYLIIGLAVMLALGVLFSIVPFYLSGMSSISLADFGENLLKPLNETAFQLGHIYIKNVTLSRILLLTLMPVFIIVYMEKISKIDKVVHKANNISE